MLEDTNSLDAAQFILSTPSVDFVFFASRKVFLVSEFMLKKKTNFN